MVFSKSQNFPNLTVYPFFFMSIQSSPGVFSDRNLRRYIFGQLISFTGSMLQNAVLALLIISLVGKEIAATAVGIQTAIVLIPGACLAPFAGLLTDRWNKRAVLILSTIIYSIQTTGLLVLTCLGAINLTAIYCLAAIGGIAAAFDGVARYAIVKDIVSNRGETAQAMKIVSSLYTIANIAGSGAAGYIVILLGYHGGFILNLLSNISLIFVLMSVRLTVPYIPPVSKVKLLKPAMSGLKYVFEHQQLRLCAILTVITCCFGFLAQFLMPVIARYMLHGDELVYSHLGMVNGIGSLVGSFITIYFRKITHKVAVLGGMGLTGVAVILMSFTTTEWAACSCMFFVGLGMMAVFGTLRGSFMHATDSNLSGVSCGWQNALMYGGFTAASLVGGRIVDKFGCAPVLATCGIVLLVTAAVTSFLKGVEKL